MTNHKRKASQELTSNSVPILLPVQIPMAMKPAPGVWSRLLSWLASFNLLSMPTYTTMTYGSSEIVAETHIQSSEPRKDGTATVKRMKTNRPKPRSRSAVDEYRKGGRGELDYTGCVTESDRKQRYDAYWRPPEHKFLNKAATFERPRTPESLSDDEDIHNGAIQRRYSEPSGPLPSTLQSAELGWTNLPATTPSKLPSTPDVLPRDRFRTSGDTQELSLAERVEALLLTPGEEQKDHKSLYPSGYATEKRKLQAAERQRREKEAAIRAAKNLRLNRRRPLKPLVQQLSLEWEDIVNERYFTNDSNRVITTSIGGTELRIKDFRTLLGHHAWLNDEIINSYIEWIVDAANTAAIKESEARDEPPSKVPKFIAHNSFFYENLIKKGPSGTQGLMRRKKAPGVSLMEVDSVFIPICKGNHWTVGVVRPVAKTIEYFDSFGSDSKVFISLVRSWLKFQLGDSYVDEEWKVPRTACAEQSNGWDCGVFVCTNSLCVALGLDTSCYEEGDLAQQRRNIAAVLINRGFVGKFAWGQYGL